MKPEEINQLSVLQKRQSFCDKAIIGLSFFATILGVIPFSGLISGPVLLIAGIYNYRLRGRIGRIIEINKLPRHLTVEQGSKLAAGLREAKQYGINYASVLIWFAFTNLESRKYAEQIAAVFKDVGWQVEGPGGGDLRPHEGLSIFPMKASATEATNAVKKAFIGANIPFLEVERDNGIREVDKSSFVFVWVGVKETA